MNPLKSISKLFAGKKSTTGSGIFGFYNQFSAPKMSEQDYLKAYRGWVFSCVNAIAGKVSEIEIQLQQRQKDGSWKIINNHPAMDVLINVNDYMTFPQLAFWTQAMIELDGNAFWYLVKNGRGQICEIWPLDPSKTQIVKSETKYIAGYVFQTEDGKKVPFDPDEIIQFKTFNPLNSYRGMSTVEAAAIAIDTNQWASEYQRNFFGNSAMPSSVLSVEGDLSQEQYDRIRADWNAHYKGTANAHKMLILENAQKWTPINPTFKEMQFTESRKDLKDEIGSIFRVPAILLGMTEGISVSNAEASEVIFMQDVINPKDKSFVGFLTEFYLPLWPDLNKANYRIWYVDPVPENIEQKRADAESGIQFYYRTINETRALYGLEGVEGGDYIYVPSSVIPVTGDPAQTQSNPTDTSEPLPNTPSKGYYKLPLKSAVQAKKKDVLRKKYLKSEQADRTTIVEKAIPKALKMNLQYTEQLKTLILKNMQSAKSMKHKENRSELQLLKDAINPANSLIKLAFDGYKDWVGLLMNATTTQYSGVLEAAGIAAVTRVGANITFDLKNPRALKRIQDHVLENVGSYADTIKDEISQILIDGIDNGESVDTLTTEIGAYFDSNTQWKAERIARTETIDAYNQGNLEGFIQAGVPGKSWLPDAEACDICATNADDGIIPVSQNFSSGDDAPPGHPNCECTVLPEVDMNGGD